VDPIPTVERDIGLDLVRRAALVAPVVLVLAYVWRGVDGLAGAAVALGLVVCNFLAGALTLAWASKRGPVVLGAVAVGGFLVRMLVVVGVIVLVEPYVDLVCLAIVLLVTHLGLLVWETRSLSISLAAPGLRPALPVTHQEEQR
jgi:hypothetical protein